MTGAAGAFASRLAAGFVALDEGTPQQTTVDAVCVACVSDHVYNWSACNIRRFTCQSPLGNSLDDWELSCSSKLAKSRSKSASHRRGDKPSEGEGSAQSVHSRATLKVPHSNPRKIRVSTPATHRVLSTGKL